MMTPETFVKRPIEWLRAISRYRGTVSFAPNFAYDLAVRRVKDADLAGLDLSSWRVAGCGAEPIHAPTLSAFADKFRACRFPRRRAFFQATAWRKSCSPRRCRRPDGGCGSSGFSPDDLTVKRRRDARQRHARGNRVGGRCGTPLPGHDVRIVGRRRPAAARPAYRRNRAERALGEPRLLQ